MLLRHLGLLGALVVCAAWGVGSAQGATVLAGAAKVNASMAWGVPLAGLSARKNDWWPLFRLDQPYTTWMQPSTGRWDETWARALYLNVDGTQFIWVTLDVIGGDDSLMDIAYGMATSFGLPTNVSRNNVILSASHSHSGPGAMSTYFLWQVAPATDLCVGVERNRIAAGIGRAMAQAYANQQPALIDIAIGQYHNLTHNRRAGNGNPYVNLTTVDPNLDVLAVNLPDGTPLATVWGIAMHGTCLEEDNLKVCGDIMGSTNLWLEAHGAGIAMFHNADAGDVDPNGNLCQAADPNNPCNMTGAPLVGEAVLHVRSRTRPTDDVSMMVSSHTVDFGLTDINFTFARFDNCTSGGPLDICGICKLLDCTAPLHLNDGWIEQIPRFSAISWVINGVTTVGFTVPGEALTELGLEMRSDTKALGYDQTIIIGYSNSHMAYFATPNEYLWGGYESQLTFWGISTSEKIRTNCSYEAAQVLPPMLRKKSGAFEHRPHRRH